MIQSVSPAETYHRHHKNFRIFSIYFPYMIQSVILKQNKKKEYFSFVSYLLYEYHTIERYNKNYTYIGAIV